MNTIKLILKENILQKFAYKSVEPICEIIYI